MVNPTQLKVVYFHNELNPDQLQDLALRLRIKSRSKDHIVLRQFLHGATTALRGEVRLLPIKLRSLVPPFRSILDLIDVVSLRQSPLWTSVEAVLLCAIQLSLFIGHSEKSSEPYIATHASPHLAALGVGLLSAVAVAISPTLADLPSAGAEAIRIAFRLGILSFTFSENIEQQPIDSSPQSWAYVVTGVAEIAMRDELESFHKTTKVNRSHPQITPPISQLFISSVGDGNLIVSGPPSKLVALFKSSEKLRYASFAPLPIYGGACHAPHLYNDHHVESLLETVRPVFENRALPPNISLLSPGNGKPYVANTATGLLRIVAAEPLRGTIRWPTVLDTIAEIMNRSVLTGCEILSFGDSLPLQDLAAAAKRGQNNSRGESHIVVYDLVRWVFDNPLTDNPVGTADSKIAIVGMSCRFPGGANDLESFWELLEEGRDVHQKVPPDRYDVESHTDLSGEQRNASLTPFGCFIDQPGLFDAGFFNMSPREAAQTDPMHRLALVTAYEALEQSGFVPNRTVSSNQKRVGTFYGQACDDYREVNAGQDVDTYFIPGGCRAFAPGRINYFFKFSGPSFNCDTACSSSLSTIQMACTSLLHGETDTVVAGGLNILTNSDGFAGLSRGHFLSQTGSCKTWDATADGYCRADGIGSIVMKRLEDAEADNDNILGVILSAATNHSADAQSITHPHAPTQAELYKHVLNQAGVSPSDVDYIEMHGTGTQAGDTTEMKSVTEVFSMTDRWSRKRTNPLYIGAVKANVGHGEAAAGIMALIKTLLIFQKNSIPRHVGIKTTLNPQFPNLQKLNVHIPLAIAPWERSLSRKRYAVVNNFSAAGGNTTILLEEPPVRPRPTQDPRGSFVVAISARSKGSLGRNLESLLDYINTTPSLSLADLSYTSTSRRMHHNHRIAVSGSSLDKIRAAFCEHLPTVNAHQPIPVPAPPVAFGFSGQGTFYNGMGRQLFALHKFFRTEMLQLDDICLKHGFPSILPVISMDVPEGHVFAPIITQLSLVCLQIALCRLWQSLGIKPSVVVGCSLGEYAALYAAGVLSAGDAIYLCGSRAKLMETLCTPNTHVMVAVGATFEQIQQDLSGLPCELACLNAPNSVCIAGPNPEIDQAIAILEPIGHKCHKLDVPYAFHSAQMEPILEEYETLAEIISPLLNDVVFDGITINASYLARATRQPVQLEPSLRTARGMEVITKNTIWIDIGPHPIFATFVGMTLPDTTLATATIRRDEDNWSILASSMAKLYNHGVDINWMEWNDAFESNLRLLDLPSYKWNNKNYWIQYNGDWMLTKDRGLSNSLAATRSISTSLRTSLVHRVVDENICGDSGRLIIQSDVMQPEFLKAAGGHRMNGFAVVTSAIHADIAFTLAKYLYSRFHPGCVPGGMSITDLHYKESLVAYKDPSRQLWIQVEAVADLATGAVHLDWAKVDEKGNAGSSFLSAVVKYGRNESWLDEWVSRAHLVTSRINVLEGLAVEGVADRLSRDTAYNLFAKLVDYAEEYRGMRSVILNDLEAMADIVLTNRTNGTSTVPPEHIESVVHLAGFILNGGHTLNQRENFFVTPGWKSMRFARPLLPGGRYRSYVKMQPLPEPGYYAGDVYILQNEEIIGLVEDITFRKFPRSLLNHLFSAPSSDSIPPPLALPVGRSATRPDPPIAHTVAIPAPQGSSRYTRPVSESRPEAHLTTSSPVFITPDTDSSMTWKSPVIEGAVALIAAETGISVSDLVDETKFATIGVDSLLSLVLSQKFSTELQVEVKSALFLECPTIGDLKAWLIDYC
ncbi:hypothetical protein BDW59DRAFT_175058 [Aspergillus cavernicola]|uniref:Polyketide synthase n=1 Tax=Aspergillus cavernicola TaxID=176166 RepID=A0ABR4HTA0_9EURO